MIQSNVRSFFLSGLPSQFLKYFINTGIGFSGWIMSRDFLRDFMVLYGNKTLDQPIIKTVNSTTKPGETETVVEQPEIRPGK